MLVQLYGNIYTCEVCHLPTFAVPVKCHFFIGKNETSEVGSSGSAFQAAESVAYRKSNKLSTVV